ncbi:tyrosine-type recombinase/integrase [Streptomyces sp. NBC_00280]|uniref:tyrosine-type recombinase/integrase n=1 Tax=Streptomyces sp. NBC_00280 TaxID=2975699 RepID=UPI00324FE673
MDPGVVPWLVFDEEGKVVQPVRRFLIDFIARDNRTGSVRSYAFDLLRWWRWLRMVDVEWHRATSVEVRDFVLWLRAATKPRRSAWTHSAATAGTTNPITRKTYLDDLYKPRTIRHSNAVLRNFYDFWIETGGGPLVNPVPLARSDRRRPHAHHNPLEPYRGEGRLRYNPKVPKRRPRQMPDEQWNELFAALRSNRDRAILALAVSNGARASELLGVRGVDLDWGDQLVRVVRKGTLAEQRLPASPEAFIWIRFYLAEGPPLDPQAPLWWTLRRRDHGEGLRWLPRLWSTGCTGTKKDVEQSGRGCLAQRLGLQGCLRHISRSRIRLCPPSPSPGLHWLVASAGGPNGDQWTCLDL